MACCSSASIPPETMIPIDTPNAMTVDELRKLDSLVAWLQTFPQFDFPLDESVESTDALHVAPIAEIVLRITEEVTGKNLQSDVKQENADSIWGQVFSALTSPKLMRKIAGRRLSSTELRFVLLSALLATGVSEACPQRVTYINRIMELPKPVQHSLMNLIESFPKTPNRTPTKSPARSRSAGRSSGSTGRLSIGSNSYRSVSTSRANFPCVLTPRTPTSRRLAIEDATPRSSGNSIRDLSQSFASVAKDSNSRSSSRSHHDFSAVRSPPSGDSNVGGFSEKEILALLYWMKTFPEMSHMTSVVSVDHLQEKKVSLAALHVAEYLCGQPPSPPVFSMIEDIWDTMHSVITRVSPTHTQHCMTEGISLVEKQSGLLSALLCFAVTDGCRNPKANIAKILSLPSDMQQRLMRLIERNRHFNSPSNMSRTPSSHRGISPGPSSNGGRRSRADDSTPSGFTPNSKRQSLLFSPVLDEALENMIEDLKVKNKNLQAELESSTHREAELAIKMQEFETKVRGDMMKLEAKSMREAEEASEAHERELHDLREELNSFHDIRDKEQKAQRELAALRDEIDLMQHTQDKLADTEEKLRKCRERLEQLVDVKECLRQEEEAHNASVEECLRLENELQSLAPVRRQLEEYKARSVEAEFKLIECEEELKRMSELNSHLNTRHEELVGDARLHQRESETLRKKLSDDTDDDSTVGAVGEGISEMNPVVKEELLRLRNENAMLREFAAKRGTDGVQRLEERLDDIQRLSSRFKEQYLSTKKELEATSLDLDETRNREETLKKEVSEWTAKWEEMDELTKELQQDLDVTRLELEDTSKLLEESEQREKGLREDVQDLNELNDEIQAKADACYADLEEHKEELKRTHELLVQSREEVETLEEVIEELDSKLKEEKERSSSLENERNMTAEDLEETKAKLEATLGRENSLRTELFEVTEVKNSLDGQLANERSDRQRDCSEAQRLLEETREALKAEGKRNLSELRSNMTKCLESERAAYKSQLEIATKEFQKLTATSSAKLDELNRSSQSTFATMKKDYEEKIQKMEMKHKNDVESIRNEDEEEREKLFSKGKAMLKESKEKASAIICEMEDELDEANKTIEQLLKERDQYQHMSLSKISSYKQKLHFSVARINELSEENESLHDAMKVLEKEKSRVLDENERYRRQLGGRYGADGKTQNQVDMLQKEFNAILEENRDLKKKLASGSTGLEAISESNESDFGDSSEKPYSSGGVSGSTLLAVREEYEEQIQALIDEKRELVMRNSAAITDVQKAEQRTWEMEKETERLKEELTSAHLALQRAERNVDQMETVDQSFHSAREQSFHSTRELNSPLNVHADDETSGNLLMDLDIPAPTSQSSSPGAASAKAVLSPTNRHNIETDDGIKKAVSFSAWETRKPIVHSDVLNISRSSDGPTLMDLTQQNQDAGDGQPECKQS